VTPKIVAGLKLLIDILRASGPHAKLTPRQRGGRNRADASNSMPASLVPKTPFAAEQLHAL
jgi:hypothetical protein